jgi:anaerobic ribonucleoside-triphosphate reductase
MSEKFVIKRNGAREAFNPQKIINAVKKSGFIKDEDARHIASAIESEIEPDKPLQVEQIQDRVEELLMASDYKNEAREYIRYRKTRELIRNSEQVNESILRLIDDKNDYLKTENSNKNHRLASTQRDYIAGEVSKDIAMRLLLPKDVVEAHQKGIIHFHDSDYFIQHEFNCCLIDLEDILQNGTVINGTLIEKPHSFSTACNIATQVSAIVASNQYGGQTISLAHLAPFVDVSRKKIASELAFDFPELKDKDPEKFNYIVQYHVWQEIKRGVQTIQYQINTLNSSNGQTPFITVWCYLNEAKSEQEKEDLALIIQEVLYQRIEGVKNEQGVWISPAFPKIIYALEEDNCREGTKYWWLTKIAAQCTAKRLVPDYISEKVMKQLKGACFPSMGCRSFLSPWKDKDGNYKFYGRFNQGVVTLNLPYLALMARKSCETTCYEGMEVDQEKEEKKLQNVFFYYLNQYAELCHRALQARHARLLNTPVETSPLHWQYGAIARLPKGSNINELLYGGYSTISLGYAGLYEATRAITGESHTEPKGKAFALAVMKKLNEYCEKWKEAEGIGYSVYGTPIESTTYKFAKALKRDFGEIKEISDHDYVTNSYHINVREHIDPFKKLKLEAEFQALSQGGCISYIETANLQNNVEAILEVIKFIYDNIMYAELNTKSDYCQVCGSTDEIKIVEDENGKLVWECPHCGNRDQSKMNVVRRTCGYLGSQFWNQGRTQEIRDRYVHLGTPEEMKLD